METYRLRGVGLQRLIEEVDQLWHNLEDDKVLIADVETVGIDVSSLANIDRRQVIKISSKGQGIDGSMLMDVSFATAISGAHIVAYDLWKRVILPRLQRKFGKDAVYAAGRGADKRKKVGKKKEASNRPKSQKGMPAREVRSERTTLNGEQLRSLN